MDKPKRSVGRPNSKFDLGKALKLRMKGLSYQDIGVLVGASKDTVEGKIRPLLMALGAPEQITAYRANEAGLIAGVRAQFLANISSRASENKGSLSENVLAFGVLFDKNRLLEEKSTASINILTQVIEQAANAPVSVPIKDAKVVPDQTIDVDSLKDDVDIASDDVDIV